MVKWDNHLPSRLLKYKSTKYLSPLNGVYLRRVQATHGPRGPDLRVLEPLAVVAVLLRPGPVVPGVLVASGDTLQ